MAIKQGAHSASLSTEKALQFVLYGTAAPKDITEKNIQLTLDNKVTLHHSEYLCPFRLTKLWEDSVLCAYQGQEPMQKNSSMNQMHSTSIRYFYTVHQNIAFHVASCLGLPEVPHALWAIVFLQVT